LIDLSAPSESWAEKEPYEALQNFSDNVTTSNSFIDVGFVRVPRWPNFDIAKPIAKKQSTVSFGKFIGKFVFIPICPLGKCPADKTG
jgi:hypothetical protein